MKKFATFATRHPILFGFILIVLFSILSTLTWPITQTYPAPEGYEVGEALAKFVIAGCFILLLWRFGWLKKAGFTSLGQKRIWDLVIVLAAYKAILSVYAFTGSFKFSLPAANLTAAILLFTFAASLLEETIHRGLLLGAMIDAWGHMRKGLFTAASERDFLSHPLYVFVGLGSIRETADLQLWDRTDFHEHRLRCTLPTRTTYRK